MSKDFLEVRKNCLILGASSDIAQAISEEFAKKGFDLILAGRNTDEISKIANNLTIRFNVQAQTVYYDILDVNSQAKLIEDMKQLPDGIIFSVGYLGDQKETENDFSEAKKVIDTNFTYAIYLLNYFANEFEKRRSGFIIGIGSVAGERGRKKNYIYGASKSAFHAYFSGLRNRLSSSNVFVMTVKPGFVRTKMTENLDLPGKLTAEPKEVAKDVMTAFRKKKDVVFSKKIYRYMFLIIKHIPEKIFKKLDL